ncbi:hypothetical protein FVF58_25195 [Paraburkholderia panacisoli]|uniref:Uncharacterized protein n=1 Tax=Paraburkholderia panacisoli TaxID=2603818 RepID=A0A5B0GVF9_9BURK|nr:hypothetical protein [Paraburkholderia panacisoli]KAA1006849.1 hypothetical protein FVF58_25195 [Paraburkholderia panacisoli]
MINQETHSRILDLNPLLKELLRPIKRTRPASLSGAAWRDANSHRQLPAIELLVLPSSSFKQLFSWLELFDNQVFNHFSERLTELMKLVTAMTFQKREQRLASLLLSRSNPIEMIASEHRR